MQKPLPYAYDLARVITKDEFTEQILTYNLSSLVRLQKGKHKLSGLALGFRDGDVDWEHRYPQGHENPTLYNALNKQHCIADVLCLNGAASAYIKFGESVKVIQISGDHDPREVRISGRLVRILSFGIRTTENGGLDAFPRDSSKDWIVFFVIANPLLDTAQAATLQAKFMSELGTRAVSLVVRPDPAFWQFDGPTFDMFHAPFPDIPMALCKKTRYIFCWPVDSKPIRNRQACEVAFGTDYGGGPQ